MQISKPRLAMLLRSKCYPDDNLRFRCGFPIEFAAKCPPIRWRIRSELVATTRIRSEVAAIPRFLHEFASESADISLANPQRNLELSSGPNVHNVQAVAIASTLTDRHCIASNGTSNFRFSDQDLLACSRHYTGWTSKICTGRGQRRLCAPRPLSGCEGGSMGLAWKYLTNSSNGIVSGGHYKSDDGCLSYEYPPCDHTKKSCYKVNEGVRQPECSKGCLATYNHTYLLDKRRITSACQFNYPYNTNVTVFNEFVKNVQLEIMQNGPIIGVLRLYPSFDKFNPRDENEIYKPSGDERYNSLHAVKIIGWGIGNQNGTELPYWLVSNSFNYYWGNRGFFKIFRGKDVHESAGINEQLSAGMPLIV
ncbi:Cathepsin B [Folsomia candida]|uniref:Cathepsin B n=1 Tax=Folsomia candida TaxID=158441 RepID=A0A226F3S8_FOLCA|nr:Cathepsin B [Folsomia candida]